MDRSKAYWRAEAGCIVADSTAGADHDYIWLTTERDYGDFELRLKFQAFRDSTGNSGVQIRSRYDEAACWLDGPQLDIHPPAPWRTGMIYDETRGVQKWISPSVPKVTDVRPDMAAVNLVMHFADELTAWNDFQITARGTRVRAVLNGVVVQDWDGAGLLDDATHRQRNVGLRGHIALQIHRGDRLKMRFKDITLRELSGKDYAVVTARTKSALVSALGWWAVQKTKAEEQLRPLHTGHMRTECQIREKNSPTRICQQSPVMGTWLRPPLSLHLRTGKHGPLDQLEGAKPWKFNGSQRRYSENMSCDFQYNVA